MSALMTASRRLIITVMLLCHTPAYAQYFQYPYTPPFDYRQYPPIQYAVPFHQQDTMVWCWVAAAKMIADHYRWRTPSQCEMLQIQYGAPCCSSPQLCARPGHIMEVQTLITRFGGRISALTPPADGFALYNALRRGPIVLHTLQGAGHFVVVTGMKVVPTQWGPLGIVKINDPFFGPYDIEFPHLLRVWDAALVVY